MTFVVDLKGERKRREVVTEFMRDVDELVGFLG
jgi:hypothetical protein